MPESQLFEKYGHVLDTGRIIFKEGEEGDQMFIIQDGKVRISKLIDGKDHVLAVLGKGDFFGEMALVTRERRAATAATVAKTELLAFDRQGFRSMIEKNSKIAMNVIDRLCRRLQNANLQIQHLVRRNEKSLVALNLKYAFEASDRDGAVAYDRIVEEISLNLGVPNKDIAQVFEDFVKAGIISLESNSIRLLSTDKLAAL